MIRERYPDLTEMWDGVCHSMWHDLRHCHDGYRGKSALSLDNVLSVDHIVDPVDPSDVNYTAVKFGSVVRSYVNQEALDYMIGRAQEYVQKRRDIATEVHFTFNEVGGHLHPRGSCLLACSLGWMKDDRPRLAVYSRASECTNTMPVDSCLFYALAKYIGERLDVPPQDFKLTWFIGLISFNAQMCPPWVLRSGHLKELMDTDHEDRPWMWRRAYQGINKALTTPESVIATWPFRREARYAMWIKNYHSGKYNRLPQEIDVEALSIEEALKRGGKK